MALLVDSANVRMLVFRLTPGQSVPPHHNASTVIIHVLQGEGMLSGADGERPCAAGDVVAYEPSETHGMRAVDSELLLLVTIAPSPGRG